MKLGETIASREDSRGNRCLESEVAMSDGSVLYAWLRAADSGAPLFSITPKHCEDALSDYDEEIERILDAEIYAPPGASLPRPTSAYSDRCDWALLYGETWTNPLVGRSGFVDCCDWSKLKGGDWYHLLDGRPEFASRKWSTLLPTRREHS